MGGSTLITSAPRSASIRVAWGPESTRVKSSTRTPSRGRSPCPDDGEVPRAMNMFFDLAQREAKCAKCKCGIQRHSRGHRVFFKRHAI